MERYHEYRRRVGLDSVGSQHLPPAPIVNPFKKGSPHWNLTAAMEIEKRDPLLAARLKALAEE